MRLQDPPTRRAEPGQETGDAALLFATVVVALRVNLRRLTTWVFAAVFLLVAFLLYRGPLRFGGMTSSGVKLATNAEYAIAAVMGAFSFFLMHFTATLTGDPVVKDLRLGVTPILATAPIGRRTYLLGKFLGGYASLLSIYAVFVAALVIGQLLPPSQDKLTLPFRLWPYLKFALLFVLVPTFFVGALSFAIGTVTGSMKAVYITVTALLVGWFLVIGALDDEALRWLAYIEPSGQAWLAEKVANQRGNAWLNEHAIQPDLGLLLNRAALLAVAGAALLFALRRWRPLEGDVEFGGEVGPGRIRRLLARLRGRPPLVADLYTNWVGRGTVPLVEPTRRGPWLWLAQLSASLATELRLLAAERSLWIMVPMTMLLAGIDSVSHAGPFSVRVYPVSSEFAQQMVPTLLILLSGTTIFYTGEVFHRDDDNGVRGILYASPVANSTLLLAKLLAILSVSIAMVLLTVLTAVVSQAVQWTWIDGRFYLDLVPYGAILARVVLPALLFLSVTALAVNVLVRGRYLAYFICILLGVGYAWLLIEGRRSLLFNPLLIGHWVYSDLTGLEPYLERMAWHRRYWGAVLVCLIALSCWWMQRTQGGWRQYVSPHALRARPWGAVVCALCLCAAVIAGLEIQRRGNVRGTRPQLERAALDLEDRHADLLAAPRLSYRRVSIEVDLHPERGALDVRGGLELENSSPHPIATACFTVDPLYEIRLFELEGAAGPPRREGSLVFVPLARPLPAWGRATLQLDWSGVVRPGWEQDGGQQASFLHRRAGMLSSLVPAIVPVPGVSIDLFLGDRERRAEHDRSPFEPLTAQGREGYVPALFGSDLPFQLSARISAPAGLRVLCGGELDQHTVMGERELFVYQTRAPVRTFAILYADYDEAGEGVDEIFHHRSHTYNLPTIRAALADGRRSFQASFGPYPHERLRIAEFPRLADFAQSFPTLMPYSESIGFLTNHEGDQRRINATYFVTAHEVAHQWWGYIETPAMSPGALVLTESLAEYSAMALIDETYGERARLVFLRQEEDTYLRQRDPDTELPLARLQLEGQPVRYNKGCLVFYMLERRIGRARLQAGLASFVARWRHDEGAPAPGAALAGGTRSSGHPTLQDLLDELRAAHRGEYLEWFYDQWFDRVIVPDLAFDSAPILHAQEGAWTVEFTATNLGAGRVPVQVEAVRGKWRPNRRGGLEEGAFEHGGAVLLWLEPGKSTRGLISSTFLPEAVVIDRLQECIDFDRTNNVGDLDAAGASPTAVPARSSGAPARQ